MLNIAVASKSRTQLLHLVLVEIVQCLFQIRAISQFPMVLNLVKSLNKDSLRNFGFVGKGTCIPSRFAVDEIDSPLSNMRHGNICVDNNGKTVKQEPYMDYMDNQKVGIPILQRFSSSDITRVFTK
ncbi:Two-component response regulator [Quillaja saponaria]|uniref:Two-component response regulator n=1 Tax=Quillaja saponaria TaxID=32244 RepID=A0AAD7LA79_QUISA|nr:Two-component response regulator [Quillaja saponaria]